MKPQQNNDPLLLANFVSTYARDPERAVSDATKAGLSISAAHLPNSVLTEVNRLRGNGQEVAARALEGVHAASLIKLRAAAAMVADLESGEIGPLVGLTSREKLDAIVSGQSGLSHVDAVDQLRGMDEHAHAMQYIRTNPAAGDQLAARDLSKPQGDQMIMLDAQHAAEIHKLTLDHSVDGRLVASPAFARASALLQEEHTKRVAALAHGNVRAQVALGAADLHGIVFKKAGAA